MCNSWNAGEKVLTEKLRETCSDPVLDLRQNDSVG